MKKYLLLIIISVQCISCQYQSGKIHSLPLRSNLTESDDCSQYIVGERYMLAASKMDDDNPFEQRSLADVTILQKQNGFVQYCWTHDLSKESKTTFSRSCAEFATMVNRYKQLNVKP